MSEYQIVPASEVAESFSVIAKAHGGIFFSEEILKSAGAGTEQIAIVQNGGKCLGGFNLQVIKLKGFKTIAAPQFHPHCGLFIIPLEGSSSTILGRKKKIISAISSYLSSRPEPITSIPFPPEVSDMQPFIWDGFRTSIKYTYRLDLKVHKDLLDAYSAKTRNSIKKAMKLGVNVNPASNGEAVLQMLNSNAEEQGFGYDQAALLKFIACGLSDQGLVFSAFSDSGTVATAVTVADERVAYYLFGGIDRKANVQGALGFVLHELISAYQKRGLQTFDFEGSMIPAVENFFRSFGGQQVPYYVIAKAPFWLTPFLRLRGKKEF